MPRTLLFQSFQFIIQYDHKIRHHAVWARGNVVKSTAIRVLSSPPLCFKTHCHWPALFLWLSIKCSIYFLPVGWFTNYLSTMAHCKLDCVTATSHASGQTWNPQLKDLCRENVASGQGYIWVWSSGGMVSSRGKPMCPERNFVYCQSAQFETHIVSQ